MLAVRKSNSSRLFPENLSSPSLPFACALKERFPQAVDLNSGNGHEPSQRPGESYAAGLLLLDASLRPIYASEEAVAILAYPGVASKSKGLDNFLQNRIRSLMNGNGHHKGATPSKFPKEVFSGKRSYQLRAFSMKSSLGIERGPAVALLLERNRRGSVGLEIVARKFRLTQREKETVDWLVQDLSTKQIASQMNISPNTAKAFIRSVMIKLGVENRTGIIGRILQASSFMNGENFI